MSRAHSEIRGDCSDARPAPVNRSNTMPTDVRNADEKPRNPLLRETLVIDAELFHERLSEELTLKVLKLADKLGCMVNYYHDHHIYVAPRNERHLEAAERYKTLTGSEEFFVYLNDVTTLSTQTFDEANSWGYKEAVLKGLPSKLIIFCDNAILDKVVDDCRVHLNGSSDPCDQSYRYNAHIIRGAPPFFVEVLNPGVHKGRGLVRLCESLDVPLEEVLAFGDGDNDAEFLTVAGFGIAMKNARENVKELADSVTEWTNDEDGVIRTLQNLEETGRLMLKDS